MVTVEEWRRMIEKNIKYLLDKVASLESDLFLLKGELKPFVKERNKARILRLLEGQELPRSGLWLDNRLDFYTMPLLNELVREGALETVIRAHHTLYRIRRPDA